MKQQTRHNKTEKDLFDTLYSWIILVVFVICFLDMRIEEEMICNFTWWYLFFAIAGFIAGIICLFRYEKIKSKKMKKKWEKYALGFLYTIAFIIAAVVICAVITSCISLANYYIPTNKKLYTEKTVVVDKFIGHYRGHRTYHVIFNFENEKFGEQNFNWNSDFYDQAQIGDTYIFTLQNGFLNIPVIKDKTKQ